MEIKKGIGVSPGVVISTAVVLDAEDLAIPKRHVADAEVENEVARFQAALEKASAELEVLRRQMSEKYSAEIGNILNFHIAVLKDRRVIAPVVAAIRSEKVTAEYGVSVVMRRYASNFQAMQDKYLSERVKDIYDIERRILRSEEHTSELQSP